MSAVCTAYHPSDLDNQHYWSWQSGRRNVDVDLPQAFPRKLVSQLSWKGEIVIDKESEWTLALSRDDVEALDGAVRDFEESQNHLSTISASTFRLPEELASRLRHLSDNIYKGYGFQVVHGIDPSRYSSLQNVILYAGLCAHICPQRGFIDVAGQRVMGHVVNVQGDGSGSKTVAPAFSNIPLSFHTDNCEVLSFYYKSMPAQGGRPTLSSSWQVYNELAESQPEVLQTLAEPWVYDSMKLYSLQAPRSVQCLSILPEGSKPPVLFRFSRYPILGWQKKRNSQLPEPTIAQLKALDAVQFVAQKNSITLPVSTGDMVFINDMAVFHAREGFTDQGEDSRHLLKMYLRDPDQEWNVPQPLLNAFGSRYANNSGDGTQHEIWDLAHTSGLEDLSFVNG